MDTVVVVLGNAKLTAEHLNIEADYVGVDRGAYYLAQLNHPILFSIGDFDSVSQSEFEHIGLVSKELVQLDSLKDESDFDATLRRLDHYQHIIVISSWGNRFDHSYVNLELVKRDSRITFLDDHNKIKVYEEGQYSINKENYKYLSLFALQDSQVSLTQTKFEIIERKLTPKDLYTLSNEILHEQAQLTIHFGSLLVIQSND